MNIKAFVMFLGVSSTLYSGGGLNTTTPMAANGISDYKPAIIAETKTVWLTAYSSTPEETDDTPFITASGSHVRDGIVATNLLPFGTKIKIPELFGDKVFIVEDRMHARKANNVDIWMQTKQAAQRFGVAYSRILILKEVD